MNYESSSRKRFFFLLNSKHERGMDVDEEVEEVDANGADFDDYESDGFPEDSEYETDHEDPIELEEYEFVPAENLVDEFHLQDTDSNFKYLPASPYAVISTLKEVSCGLTSHSSIRSCEEEGREVKVL